MNILLIFFALPIATIIISIALQKIFKCPPLVAAIIFAIFLIVTFIIGDLNLLIATIVYTIISFITASIVCLISRVIRRLREDNNDDCNCSICDKRRNRKSCRCNNDNSSNELLTINSDCGNMENGNLLTISSNGCNGINNDLLTISSNNTNGNNSGCGCNNTNTNEITARINVIPNSNTNGRTGQFSECYRR